MKLFQAYHRSRGDFNRDVVFIPRSAHGTNFATASMAGFTNRDGIVYLQANSDGLIDLKDFHEKANQYADEAQAAKKANKPHNIGAILFFLPGLGFSMANIDEASKAAKERAIHLNKLKEKKNC